MESRKRIGKILKIRDELTRQANENFSTGRNSALIINRYAFLISALNKEIERLKNIDELEENSEQGFE